MNGTGTGGGILSSNGNGNGYASGGYAPAATTVKVTSTGMGGGNGGGAPVVLSAPVGAEAGMMGDMGHVMRAKSVTIDRPIGETLFWLIGCSFPTGITELYTLTPPHQTTLPRSRSTRVRSSKLPMLRASGGNARLLRGTWEVSRFESTWHPGIDFSLVEILAEPGLLCL